MKFKDYIADKLLTISFMVFAIFTIEIFLMIYNIDIIMAVYIPLSIFFAYFVGLIIEFLRRRNYYRNIQDTLSEMKDKYLVHELIGTPNFSDAKIWSDILYTVSKAMTDRVNEHKLSREEYKEYIEMWIHDIKIPIAAGKMIVENNSDPVTKSIDEELDKIDEYTENALYYARSSTAEKDYLVKTYNLRDIVSESIRKNKNYLIRNKFRINLDALDKEVRTDSKWIVFIINQIIGNSIKYCTDEPELSFLAENSESSITLHIQDNGIGIKESEISRIFDKGFTGTNGRNANRKSTGIGLYLCKKLCGKLGMAIYASSEEGKGTDIRLVFPNSEMYLLGDS